MVSYELTATFAASCLLPIVGCLMLVDHVTMMTSLKCRQACTCSPGDVRAYYSISCMTSYSCLPFDVIAHTQSIHFVATGVPIVGGWTCESSWLPLLLLELDVSRNNISDVVTWRTVATSLHNLSLAHNNLGHVTLATFARLVRLQHLDASDNDIDGLVSGCFRHLTRLQTLNLADNQIERLQLDVFDGMTSLVELRLDGNRLMSLGDGVLASLNELKLLSASRNRLRVIDCQSFDGAPRTTLQQLNLSGNLFDDLVADVTPALACLRRLDSLTVDGNPTRQVRADGALDRRLTVRQLSISHMPLLIAVDRGALSSFSQLVTLSMTDNRRLRYVDEHALPTESTLRTLYLHNNNLTSVYLGLLSTLDVFTLHGNPLHCDCHLRWIAAEQCADCSRHHMLTDNRTSCVSPATVAGLTLFQALDSDNYTCGPRVTALFDAMTYLPIGSTLRLDCRVTGRTQHSSIVWITPARRRRPSTHVQIERSVTGSVLVVRHLEARDAGTYRCLGVNETGNVSSTASTVLRLYNVDARVLPVYVGTTSATITWSRTDSTIAAADYSVVYRLSPVAGQRTRSGIDLSVPGADSGIIHLRPYLRKYTVTGLRSSQTYEFCMTTEVGERDHLFLRCTRLTTKPAVNSPRTTMSIVAWLERASGVTLTMLVVVLVVRCVSSWRRRAYQQPTGLRSAGACRTASLSLDPLTSSQLTDFDDEHIMTSRTSLIRPVS